MIVWFSLVFVTACDCDNEIYKEVVSPDGRHKAVLFQRSCAATGRNNLQVSIVGAGERAEESGNVFTVTDTMANSELLIEDAVRISWVSPGQLAVAYAPTLQVLSKNDSIEGTIVRYVAIAKPEPKPR